MLVTALALLAHRYQWFTSNQNASFNEQRLEYWHNLDVAFDWNRSLNQWQELSNEQPRFKPISIKQLNRFEAILREESKKHPNIQKKLAVWQQFLKQVGVHRNNRRNHD